MRTQREQQRDWAIQQLRERELIEAEERELDHIQELQMQQNAAVGPQRRSVPPPRVLRCALLTYTCIPAPPALSMLNGHRRRQSGTTPTACARPQRRTSARCAARNRHLCTGQQTSPHPPLPFSQCQPA